MIIVKRAKYILIVVDNKETLNDITNNYNKEIDFEKKLY